MRPGSAHASAPAHASNAHHWPGSRASCRRRIPECASRAGLRSDRGFEDQRVAALAGAHRDRRQQPAPVRRASAAAHAHTGRRASGALRSPITATEPRSRSAARRPATAAGPAGARVRTRSAAARRTPRRSGCHACGRPGAGEAAGRQRRGAPLPVADVRRQQDHAAPRGDRRLQVFDAPHLDRLLEAASRHALEREEVDERARELLERAARSAGDLGPRHGVGQVALQGHAGRNVRREGRARQDTARRGVPGARQTTFEPLGESIGGGGDHRTRETPDPTE